MSTTSIVWSNLLPVSLPSEQNWQLASASPNAQRTTYEFSAENGRDFDGTGRDQIKFRLPSINKMIDTHAGIRLRFDLTMGSIGSGGTFVENHNVKLNGDASSVIQKIRVLTSSDQLLEELNLYNLYARLQSNATVPEYLRETALGIAQGYASENSTPKSGTYEVPLHTGLLSNTKLLNLKWLSGLVLEILVAPASDVVVCTDPMATSPSYQISNVCLVFDTITLTDGQMIELDNQWRKAGGVSYVHKTYKCKNPHFTSATGTIIVSDKSACQAGIQMCFRSSEHLNDKEVDNFTLSKPIDSYQVRTAGNVMSHKPHNIPGTNVVAAFQEVQKYYGGHSIGKGLTRNRFSCETADKGTFMVCCDFETSSLVSGNSDAKRGSVDVQIDTTGPVFPSGVTYTCNCFVSHWQVIEFNVDGTVHVNQ